jgi:outer membrane lipoprotein-sorting protein
MPSPSLRISILALGCAARAAWGDPLNDILTKLDHAAAAFRGMTADLRETAHTAVINEDQVEAGEIFMKRARPGDTRMLVNFVRPDPKTVQLQGDTLSIYFPKRNTVQEYSLGKNSSLVVQFLLLGFGTTRNDLSAANAVQYGAAETISGRPAVRLVLVPKTKEVLQHVEKIELWLSPDTGYPVQHKIYQPGGDYLLFEFANLKMAPDLSDSYLKLKLPKDVKKEKPQQ